MKRLMLLVTVLFITMSLSGCFIIREKIKAPPDEMEIPSGSSEAECTKDDHSYTYVYQNDGVYLFYIDDILQDEERLNQEQEQAFLHGESVINYLTSEYGLSNCVITDLYTELD